MNWHWLIRNVLYRIKNFSIEPSAIGKRTLVFYMDPKRRYPGLVDLLKAVVGCYYIANENGYHFKLFFETPFQLSRFLSPSHAINNWMMSPEERNTVDKLNTSVRLINYYGIGDVPKLTKDRYQVRNFIGWNILQRNNMPDWKERWHDLYHELFQPSEFLLKALERLYIKENEYIAIHVRFVNALELAEPDYPQRPLNDHDRERLIDACIKKIQMLEMSTHSKALVFSDSNLFLGRCRNFGFTVLEGQVGHITYDHAEGTILKTFLDLYSIAMAKEVFSLKDDNLYASAFPLYGSIIGGKKFNIAQL